MPLRDGVTGNTSGFELEDEGSTPSPAAKFLSIATRYFDEESSTVDLVFIRFVSGVIDEDSHVAAGLFCAAFDLIEKRTLSEPDLDELADLMCWFRRHLNGPFEHRLKKPWRARQSICWFKSNAHEHVKQAWQMARLLERNDVFMRMIKFRKVGYIIYEDNA